MKKLFVLVFVASLAMACSKNKPAATTPPPAADSKMDGKKDEKATDGAMDKKPDGATDPCAPPK
jgi:hypothetical protein